MLNLMNKHSFGNIIQTITEKFTPFFKRNIV